MAHQLERLVMNSVANVQLLVIIWSFSLLSCCGKELPVEGAVGKAVDMQCPPCEQIHCTPRRASRLKCKGGVTQGICNCCPVCAKVEGELCGGAWDYLGKCDRGLICHVTKDDKSASTVFASYSIGMKVKPEGICKRVMTNKMLDHNQMDQPSPTCKPACTPEYCSQHKRALCSAVDNADTRQSCQGDCQHTSCETCRFVPRSADCGKCPAGDLHCLRQFGKCLRRELCALSTSRGTKTNSSCRSSSASSKHSSRNITGKLMSSDFKSSKKDNLLQDKFNYQCIVPECALP